MRGKVVTLGVAVVVLAAVTGSIAVASGDSSRRDRKTLHFRVEFSDFFLLDLGEQGFSKGDQIVSNDRLLNARGREVGHDGIACTVTDPSVPEAACQGSVVLPGGQITVQFLNSPPPVKIGAITGGTDRYRNARGQLRIVEAATGRGGSITFHIIR